MGFASSIGIKFVLRVKFSENDRLCHLGRRLKVVCVGKFNCSSSSLTLEQFDSYYGI